MSLSKIALAACGMSLAFMTFAHAQDVGTWDLKDRQGYLLDPTGKAKLVRMNDTGHGTVMKEGRQLTAGAIVYMSGGKVYLLENKKMPDGTMMFDRAGNWMTGGN